MKKLVLVLAALAAIPSAAWAGDYVWIADRPSNAITIKDVSGTFVRELLGAGYNFAGPYDIVGVPQHKVVLVTNSSASPGRVTMIHSETLLVLRDITITGSSNLRGMSVSADGASVFVAGQDASGPAVYRVDIAAQSAVRVGGATDAGRGAEDCVVIRAGAVGGSGDAPGRVFFSVYDTPGYIGIIDLLGFAVPASIPCLSAAAGTELVHFPDLMERTPDHAFVFVGCTHKTTPPTPSDVSVRTIRIDASAVTATTPAVDNTGFQNLGHRSYDITFDPDTSAGITGWVLQSLDSASPEVVEIDGSGVKKATVPKQTLAVGMGTIRYSPSSVQLYVGDTSGTSQNYARLDLNSTPPPKWTITGENVSPRTGPRNFAFMPPVPTPTVTDLTPKGGPVSGGIVTVRGSGFLPNTIVQLGGIAASFTYVNDTTLLVDAAGGFAGLLTLYVENPNFASGFLDAYYARFSEPPVLGTTMGSLPTASQGYRLASVSQYATAGDLRLALEKQLGAYNPSAYRVFLWSNGAYVELDQADPSFDLAGQAFWIISRNGGTLSLTAPDISGTFPTTNRPVALQPGWNLVSQPLAVGGGQLLWSNLRVTPDGSDFATAVGVATGPGQSMVSSAFEWIGTGYVAVSALFEGSGYWIFNKLSSPVYLVFDYLLVTKPAAPSGAASAASDPAPPPPPGAGVVEESSSRRCGLLGLEFLILAALRRRRAVRRG